MRSKIRQMPVDFGYCTLTVSCDEPQVREQSLRLLQGIGYHGIAGVEWKHDPRTGLYKLIEINARAVNTIGIAPASGVDIPYIAYRDAIGQPLPPVFTWKQGVKWIRLIQDIDAARILHRTGRLSMGKWWRSIRGKRVHAVFAWDDLRPFLSDYAALVRRRTGKAVAKMRALQGRDKPAAATGPIKGWWR
jgi:predicted ATP-grasp superfamily ATP-dependent carboligase